MIIDTHAHLSDERFDLERKDIICNMAGDNLLAILTVGTNLETSRAEACIAKKNDNIFYSVGVHPHYANDEVAKKQDSVSELFELSQHEKCVAIGEVGLDYHYDDTIKENQRKVLLRQLDLANDADLPVIFHVRDAYEDMLKIVKDNRHKLKKGGVMHCFSGSKEMANEFARLGFYISFSGTITFKNAKKFPEIILSLPKDIILNETDCPYLAPTPHRGQTNYPRYANFVTQKLAEVWGMDLKKAEDITTQNALRLFSKIKL